jgi:23S rRNA (pseudouridine1915-N3)-methyltransferase
VLTLRFLWVGKTDEKEYARGIERYRSRIEAFARVEEVAIRPERERGDEAARREGGRLLAKLGIRCRTVVLDERGKMKSSEEFSRLLREHRDRDARPLAFVVGGASGLSAEVVDRADEVLSLSKMTFPHQLVRVLLLEQVYRALSISAGLRYHRPL